MPLDDCKAKPFWQQNDILITVWPEGYDLLLAVKSPKKDYKKSHFYISHFPSTYTEKSTIRGTLETLNWEMLVQAA